MATFVFRPKSSTGARELATALGSRRLRYFENRVFFRQNMATGRRVPVTTGSQDVVVCWGAHAQNAQVRTLNNVPLRSKYDDAVLLRQAGVPTVEVSRTRPVSRPVAPPTDPAHALFQSAQEMADDFSNLAFPGSMIPRTAPFTDGVSGLIRSLTAVQTAMRSPIPVPVAVDTTAWVGRMNNHVGGNDLLAPPSTPDFYVKKESLVREFRVHSFLGRSIRAGVKSLREGFATSGTGGVHRASDWVRSWDGGWRIVYDGVSATQAQRDLAHAAVAALGLDFGAVDIGETSDGRFIVLEVNRAPGVEGGTVTNYVTAINRFVSGEWAAAMTRRARRTAARRAA